VCLAIASLALAGAGSDLYKTLGVKREDATPKTIKAAYKKAALRFHPDRQVGKDAKTQKAAEAKFKEAARVRARRGRVTVARAGCWSIAHGR
jgi:DnaJ-domain-containing protein 1